MQVVHVSRLERGNRVARYVTGHAAIPGISYEYDTSDLTAPFPYRLKVTTGAQHWRFMEAVAQMPQSSIGAVIRYDKYIDTVDQAVVGIQLEAFCRLLKAHYETTHIGRND